jgi:hypothetical protein
MIRSVVPPAVCAFLKTSIKSFLQDHITGLPAEVASTPFGQMMLPMIQPMMEQHLSASDWSSQETSVPGAHVTRPCDAPLGTSSARSARSDAENVPISDPDRSVCHSNNVHEVLEGLRECQAGGTSTRAQKAFEVALSEEFATVQMEGEQDVNKAGAEAMRRVMVGVRNGMVMPPE